MKSLHIFQMLTMSVLVTISQFVDARPEYAARLGMSRCTSCHVTSVGGGHRTEAGKAYGSRGFALTKWGRQDLVALDFRGIYNHPEKVTSTRGGNAIMAVNLSGNVVLKEGQDEVRLVVGYDAGGLTQSSRDVYARFKWYEDYETSWAPQYAFVGRFHAPVGILTDEHRTYTRMQNSTSWNDFVSGALFSGDPVMSVHYDLGLINGEPIQGTTSFSQGKAALWGGVLNVRWTPGVMPFMLGTSGTYHKRAQGSSDPYSYNVYGILALDSITGGVVRGSLAAEVQKAKHWNKSITNRYFTNTTYRDSVSEQESQALMLKWSWEFNQKWTAIVKFEELIMDVKDFPSDWFRSHGLGVNYAFGPNMLAKFRYDYTDVSVPTEENKGGYFDQDTFWAMMQITL